MTEYATALSGLRKKCRDLKIELVLERDAIAIYSPCGYHFSCNDAHVCVHQHHGVTDWRIEAIKETLEDISAGLEICAADCLCKE